MAKMTKEQKKWQAEEDAHTLIRATDIEQSKARLSAALKQVKSIAKDASNTAKAANKVASRKKPAKKRARRRTKARKRK